MGKKKVAKLKGKIKHIIESQSKTGISPKINNPLLRRGFTLLGRMDAGLNYREEDLSYKELKMIDLIQSVKNKVQGKEMRKAQAQAKRR